jgi:hypothetical protein
MKSAMCGGLDAGIYDSKSSAPIELCEMILRIENPDIVRQVNDSLAVRWIESN